MDDRVIPAGIPQLPTSPKTLSFPIILLVLPFLKVNVNILFYKLRN